MPSKIQRGIFCRLFAPRTILRYTDFMMMDVKHTTCIGIDILSSRRPFSYAALDSSRRVLALGQGQILEILAFTSGQEQAVVALNAPLAPNQGLMRQDHVRQQLPHPPAPGRWMEMRVAEYLLHSEGFTIPHTPTHANQCQVWMQQGFTLVQNLSSYHYQAYPAPEAALQLLETQTDALFQRLLGQPPAEARTLEGRLQRQLALLDHGVPVQDPMKLFEEVTRFRLLHGQLSLNDVLSAGELNALAAAYLAWLAVYQPDQIQKFGMFGDGEIFLPVAPSPRGNSA